MKVIEDKLSSFLAIKGLFVEATYRALSAWDTGLSLAENKKLIVENNTVAAPSAGWLGQFAKTLNRRLELSGDDAILIELVQCGWHIEDWQPVYLWHACHRDLLLWTFFSQWIFEQRKNGIVVITVEAATKFVTDVARKASLIDEWNVDTRRRTATGLLRTSVEFHLMRGRVNKEFESYRLPERSMMYLLYALMERENNTRKVIEAEDWRLFLMEPNEVEEELLRLHQYGKLRFERAGSFLELTLPCESTDEYVRSVTL